MEIARGLLLGLLLLTAPAVQAQFTFTTNNGAITITGYTGSGDAVVVPDAINGYPVVSISDAAFLNCSALSSVTIPNSVTNIGNYVFLDCFRLSKVTIGNSVISIGEAAFADCYSLINVTIPNSVTSIGDGAFASSTGLRNITVGVGNPAYSSLNGSLFNKSQTSLVQYAIGLTNQTYSIPNTVTNIGKEAFASCYSLTSLTIGNNVTSIGNYAFESSLDLSSVTIGNNVTNIGDGAFAICKGLTNITVSVSNPAYCSLNGSLFNKSQTSLVQYAIGLTNQTYSIPNTVTSIGGGAFDFGTSLTSVTIPGSVTNIAEVGFANCSSLTSVTIPDSLTSIGSGAFANCSSLQSMIIPDGVTSIGDYTFEDCNALTSVNIGNSITSIGNYAFTDCPHLTSVTIPGSVTSIGNYAFDGCLSLMNITCLGNAPVLGGSFVLTNTAVGATVYYYYGKGGWSSAYGGLPTVMLYPPPQIGGKGGNVGVQAGMFGFTLTSVANQTVVVEASTNLVNWQPVWTNTSSSAFTNFTDSQWTNYPARYYRAR